MMLAVQVISSQRQQGGLLIHSHEGWAFQSRQRVASASGELVQAGYRSAWLIILVIQSDDTALHRLVIWRDQIDSRQFSYLHQQLAFAANPPARRNLTLWFRDRIGIQPPQSRRGYTRMNTILRRQTRSQAENTLD